MKGLKYNNLLANNFLSFLNDDEEESKYLVDESRRSDFDTENWDTYLNNGKSSKDIFIDWQRERFSDHSREFFENWYTTVLTPDEKEFECGLFADKNDKESNNDKIAEMIIRPMQLAKAAGLNKAYGYDSLIDSNIKTAVANGANIYQALSYIAEAGNRVDINIKFNKSLLNDKSTTASEKKDAIDYLRQAPKDAECLFAAEQNLLRYEKASPYSRLYRLTETLQDLQYQEEHSDNLSKAQYEKLLDDIEKQKEKIDNEILEFNPNELKLINDSRKTYFKLAANPEMNWQFINEKQPVILNVNPEMKQCTYVANRIHLLERQNKFNNNENDMVNE